MFKYVFNFHSLMARAKIVHISFEVHRLSIIIYLTQPSSLEQLFLWAYVSVTHLKQWPTPPTAGRIATAVEGWKKWKGDLNVSKKVSFFGEKVTQEWLLKEWNPTPSNKKWMSLHCFGARKRYLSNKKQNTRKGRSNKFI